MIKRYLRDLTHDPQDLFILFGEVFMKNEALQRGKSVLQIGARPGGGWIKMFNGFQRYGYEIFDVLEIWQPNVDRLNWTHLRSKVCGDVRGLPSVLGYDLAKRYDVIVFWHGLEHLPKEDGARVIPILEQYADTATILGMPYGDWKRVKLTHDNPHEAHLSAWYPEELESLGYDVYTQGEPDSNHTMFGVKNSEANQQEELDVGHQAGS